MEVTFCAFGDLRRYTPGRKERMNVEIAEPATVRQLLDAVGVPWEEIGLVVVNGQLADDRCTLGEGDKVEVFSPIGGGAGC